jgi:hypothetical protein
MRHALAAVAALTLLAGCGSASTPAATAPAAQTSAAPAAAGPSDAQLAAFVAAYRAAYPADTRKDKPITDDVRNVCLDVSQGKDAATVAKSAAGRFGVDATAAAAIVAMARTTVCP